MAAIIRQRNFNLCRLKEQQAERYAANNVYGGMAVKSVGLKQENSNGKSQFKRTGVLHDGAECIEIQISHSGDAARVREHNHVHSKGLRGHGGGPLARELRYSERNGYAYIVKYGKRLYLHKFLRIY